jgi:hypothetical protein
MDALKNSEPRDEIPERQRVLAGRIGLICLIVLIALVAAGQ